MRKYATLFAFFLFCLSLPLCGYGLLFAASPIVAMLFHVEFVGVNRSDQTLYITPIDAPPASIPRVVAHHARWWPGVPALQQKDVLIRPGEQFTFAYDGDDQRITGLVVCISTSDCRWLERNDSSLDVAIFSPTLLPKVNPSIAAAVLDYPRYDFTWPTYLGLGSLPIVLFAIWWHLARGASAVASRMR